MTRGPIAWNAFSRPTPGDDMLVVIMPSGTLWPAHERGGQIINDAPGNAGEILAERADLFSAISGWKRDPQMWSLLVSTYQNYHDNVTAKGNPR